MLKMRPPVGSHCLLVAFQPKLKGIYTIRVLWSHFLPITMPNMKSIGPTVMPFQGCDTRMDGRTDNSQEIYMDIKFLFQALVPWYMSHIYCGQIPYQIQYWPFCVMSSIWSLDQRFFGYNMMTTYSITIAYTDVIVMSGGGLPTVFHFSVAPLVSGNTSMQTLQRRPIRGSSQTRKSTDLPHSSQ